MIDGNGGRVGEGVLALLSLSLISLIYKFARLSDIVNVWKPYEISYKVGVDC